MYGLAKTLQKNFGSITKPGFGTLQPALKRMEKNNIIKSDKFFTEGGKPYYYYSITDIGKDFLKNKLVEKISNNPTQFLPNSKIKIACSDILENEDKQKLYSMIKNGLLKLKKEAENAIKSEDTNNHFCKKMILDNTICEYKNFITLIEGLEHACNS